MNRAREAGHASASGSGSARHVAEKPRGLIYGVAEQPPLSTALLLGLQHCVVFASPLVLPVAVVASIGGSPAEASNLVRLSMIATGIGSILQSLPRGPVGSGYFCPNVVGPAYLPASLAAAATGGLALMQSLTLLAGALQMLASRFIHQLRPLMPPEVSGVVVAMVGIALVPYAVSAMVGVSVADRTSSVEEVILGFACLVVMVVLTIWSSGALRLYSVLIGAAVGYAGAFLFGLVPEGDMALLLHVGWVEAPRPRLPRELVLDAGLLAAFLVTAISNTVKSVGDLSTSQKINDERWVRPDMPAIRRGVLADGLASFVAGLIGGMGQSTSSSNVGLSLATGVTSRWIGFSAGGIFIALAFFPPLAMALVIMPVPVKGAILVYVACFMIVAGLQLLMSRLLDVRKTIVIGGSIIGGLSVDFLPGLYESAPPFLHAFTTSPLSLSTVIAILLNLAMRLGIARRATLDLTPADDAAERVAAFMQENGAAWGARADVVRRATAALVEFVDVAAPIEKAGDRIRINARYDQVHLDLFLLYRGEPVPLPREAPALAAVAGDPANVRLLSGHLIRKAADEVRERRRGDVNLLRLRFVD